MMMPRWTTTTALLTTTAVATAAWLSVVHAAIVLDFDSSHAKPADNIVDLHFRSRIMVPYGPDLYNEVESKQQTYTDRPWNGFGFGMLAGEELAYDTREHYAYVASAEGYVSIVDYTNPRAPVLTPHVVHFDGNVSEINDIAICPEKGWLFFGMDDLDVIQVYATIQRSNPGDPVHLLTIPFTTGSPSNFLLNSNCTLLAASNQNKRQNLIYGTISLFRNLDVIDKGLQPDATHIPMDNIDEETGIGWNDDYVLRKGLHMPLNERSLEYWDEHSPLADKVDWQEVRSSYRSSVFVEGETLAWSSPAEDELLVNLQVNNGLLRINVTQNRALALAGYGLKDHGQVPIDINPNDHDCNLKTYPNLFAMRNPDGITTLRYNGVLYLVVSNEGDDKWYGDYRDAVRAHDIFTANDTFGLPNLRVPDSIRGHEDLFKADCNQGEDCVGRVKLSVGSTGVDYQVNATHPTFMRMVLFGGRGWTIYELPDDPDALLKLVFDSADDMERTVCRELPWAYNSVVDEEFAPTNETAPGGENYTLWTAAAGLRDTLRDMNDPDVDGCQDQGDGTPGACPLQEFVDSGSSGGGPQVEHVETGIACGRLVSVLASEKDSTAWLYDITNIFTPVLLKTFHLSPASRTKSPGVAYQDGTIGEIDPENFQFLPSHESPSGKPAILFVGAHSGTLSFWEFECKDYDEAPPFESYVDTTGGSAAASSISPSWMAIVVGLLVLL